MSEEFTGTAAQTRAYSESVRGEASMLNASITENHQIITATRTMIHETRAAMAWMNDPFLEPREEVGQI